MKNNGPRRRVKAPNLMGERLAGRCDRALKNAVAQACDVTKLDESKLVRLSVEHMVPALLAGGMVYQNGKVVPAALAPPSAQPLAATGTEGAR